MVNDSNVFNQPSNDSVGIIMTSLDFKFGCLTHVLNKLSEYTDLRLVNNLKVNVNEDGEEETVVLSFYFKNNPKRLLASFTFSEIRNYIRNHDCKRPSPEQLKEFSEMFLKDLLNHTAKLNFGVI